MTQKLVVGLAGKQIPACAKPYTSLCKAIYWLVPTLETFATCFDSLIALEQQKNWHWLRHTYQLAFSKAKKLHQYQQLGAALQKIPLEQLRADNWLETALQIASYGRNADLILELYPTLSQLERQKYVAYIAWAYQHQLKADKALELLELNFDTVQNPGLAWRTKAEALATTRQAGWQAAFEQAIRQLKGATLGICHMEYGNQSFLAGQLVSAQSQYNQAYALLRQDLYYAAWVKYNLGLVTLELNLPEAEQHFYVVQDLSQHKEAKNFTACAWNGIGAVRRSQGQWTRASFAYQCGIDSSTELDDRLAAYCGLAQTQRCAGELNAALQTLYIALDLDQNTFRDKISILIAATHLQRQEPPETQKYLQRLENPTPRGESGLRLQILNAEIMRRQNKPNAAIEILEQISSDRLCVREERHCFPELFVLADQHHWHARPLPKAVPLEITVRAQGILEVCVNQQPIRLKPTAKAAELLILLLENHKHASSEMLCDTLYPTQNNPRKAQQALWALANQLQKALGWQDSIVAKGKAYVLGQHNTQWHYDAANTTDKTRLLEGVYSEWVQEKRRNIT